MPKEPMFFTEPERQALVDGALVSLAAGQSLRSYCLANKIGYSTLWNWLNPSSGDNSPYVRAKAAGTHYLADECIDIADDASQDIKLVGDDDHEVCNTEFVQRAKLRIDTRLRLIGKWNRKDYGEKVDGEQTVKHEMSDDVRAWLDQRS